MVTEAEQHSLQYQEDVNQYLTFLLADEEYAIDILKVQEIRGWTSVTSLPNVPDYVLGVLNLRGILVPIINLRNRFNMPTVVFNATTVVIIVKVIDDKDERVVGLVVDAVLDVCKINDEEINPAPDVSSVIGGDYIKGLATINEKLVILLAIDDLVNIGVLEIESVQNSVSA